MKHLWNAGRGWVLALSLALLAMLGAQAQIPDRPTPFKPVTDLAGILDAGQEDALNSKLLAYEDSTTTQVAVVTVPSLNDYDVQQYAVELALKWKIGSKEKNNGVLLLVAPTEHRMTIQTGYGIEARLPDLTANRIISEDMRPAFKQDRYYEGIDLATDHIIKALAGEYKADPGQRQQNRSQGDGGFPWFWVIIGVFVLIYIIRRSGGGGGSTIGGNRSRGGGFFPFFFPLGGGGGGGSSWSGGGGGGSWGGGGFSGGGGGSFGGGGASGSW